MGKHSKSRSAHSARRSIAVVGGTAAGFTALMLTANPALAAAASCQTPAHSEVLHHAAITHQATNTTPGQAEIGYDLRRWSNDVPEIPAVTQQQVQVSREIPCAPAVTHQEGKYDRVVLGTPAVTQQQVQVNREVPGTPAVTHQEYQFSRTETVTVPPEGSPTIPNPSYKPAWDETVVITGAYTNYAKWNWTAPEKRKTTPDGPPPGAGWHYVGVTNDSKGNTPDVIVHAGNGNGSYFYYESTHHDAVTKIVHHDAVGTVTIPNPDYKPGHTETVTVYRTADGSASTDPAQAAWFVQDSFPEWTQFATQTAVDSPATSSYLEYRAQNGTATTDGAEAGWFPVGDLADLTDQGWSQFGEDKLVEITPATPDVTYYLTVAPDGAQSESTNEADASWVDPTVTTVDVKWTSLTTRTVVDSPATDSYLEYRAQDGAITTDAAEAGWFPVGDLADLSDQGWLRFGESRTAEVSPATPGYTEYYTPDGDPSTMLGEANWTKESPEGWTLVDQKHVVVKVAVSPVTTHATVIDKAAWNETVTTPAKDTICPATVVVTKTNGGGTPTQTSLALTGADSTMWITLGTGTILAGAAAITLVSRRRRQDGSEA